MASLQEQHIQAILCLVLSFVKKINNYKLFGIGVVIFCILGSSCTSQNKSFDIDIRSASKLKAEQDSPRFIQLGKTDSRLGFIIAVDFYTDTIYFYQQNKTLLFYFKEKNNEGISGGDCFVFSKDSVVYKVRVSNELAPDSKNYISVFKYTDKGCFNYEGKVIYKSFQNFELINKLNAFDLLKSMTNIDSSFFMQPKNDYRLSSYL